MRDFVFHATLDWLSPNEFAAAAMKAQRLYLQDKTAFETFFDSVRTHAIKEKQAHG
ncbi:MAG: hypothetical protein PHR77_12415 [Kiritimatiellae bacterium]|nr:hypothetical protein [Kiritimatiellia bacterium]MDD5519514.1 hypothetical protein [Kiritimatiellia bacterium]